MPVLQRSCSCDLMRDDVITDGGFLCFKESSFYVTYRAHLHGTSEVSALEFASFIEKWLMSGELLNLGAQLLSVDVHCPVVISTLDEPECSSTTSLTSTIADDGKGFPTVTISISVVIPFLVVFTLVLVTIMIIRFTKKAQSNTNSATTERYVMIINNILVDSINS